MKDARSCLLNMFTQNEYIRRKDFINISRLPVAMALNILSELSSFVADRGWKLRESDILFEYNHASLVNDQINTVRSEAQQ